MIELAISSWSVHGELGQVWYEPDANNVMANKASGGAAHLDLLDLPAKMAENGIYLLELCNFHLPSVDDAYLAQFRQAMQTAGVSLVNLLIDTGNLAAPDDVWRADIASAKMWLDVAQKLSAKGARIDCGTEAATPASIERSARALQELFDYAAQFGLEITTENWRTLSLEPVNLLEVMRQVERPLKLCVDFGNAEKTADKRATLNALMPLANSIHFKADFDGLSINEMVLRADATLIKQADFAGHITLIVGDTDDEWEKLHLLKTHITPLL